MKGKAIEYVREQVNWLATALKQREKTRKQGYEGGRTFQGQHFSTVVGTSLRENTHAVSGVQAFKDGLVDIRLVHVGETLVLGTLWAGQQLECLEVLEFLLDNQLGIGDNLNNSRGTDILWQGDLVADKQFLCEFGAQSNDAEWVAITILQLDCSRAGFGEILRAFDGD